MRKVNEFFKKYYRWIVFSLAVLMLVNWLNVFVVWSNERVNGFYWLLFGAYLGNYILNWVLIDLTFILNIFFFTVPFFKFSNRKLLSLFLSEILLIVFTIFRIISIRGNSGYKPTLSIGFYLYCVFLILPSIIHYVYTPKIIRVKSPSAADRIAALEKQVEELKNAPKE